MHKQQQITQLLNDQGLMPLFFNASEHVSLAVMEALYNGGVRLIEYTNRGVTALENFKVLRRVSMDKCPGLFLAAGTIKDGKAGKLFIDAGADFLVSPAFSAEVHAVAIKNNMLWIPGCMTPTEILHAEKTGITLVKLFPGNVLGPSFVEAVKELFPDMQFMPTGGVDVTIENLRLWFNAGVCAVGMGSKLITAKILNNENFSHLTGTVKEVLLKIQNIRHVINDVL